MARARGDVVAASRPTPSERATRTCRPRPRRAESKWERPRRCAAAYFSCLPPRRSRPLIAALELVSRDMRDSRAHVEASGGRPQGRLSATVRHRRGSRVQDQPWAPAPAAAPVPGGRIIALRTELTGRGLDAGPVTIAWDLGRETISQAYRVQDQGARQSHRHAPVSGSPKPRWCHRHTSWDSVDRRRRRA
jgi:hypothetical protein